MSDIMKAYTYKDSGIEWLGEIPSHWTYDKLFRLCDNVGSGGTPQSTNQSYYDGDIFWVQSGDLTDGYVYDTKKKINELAIQNSSAKVFPENTLLVAMYGATIGKVGIMTFEGAINQACCALDFSSKINPKFSYYLMLNARDYLITQAYGGGQQNISQETLKQLHLFYPSVEEQKAIADFLDKAIARIDSVLSIKGAQLHNLSLQRKSITHEAVTGKSKLNINCETKYSGIEWLGEIPSHWTYDKLFRLCDNVGSGGTPQSTNQSYYDGDIFWVQSGDLTDGYVYDTKKKINELAIQNSSAKVFPENTLLVAMYGATIGKVGIMTFEGAINQACCALDFSSKINPKFSYYLMLNARDYLITQAYGGGQQNISQETLKQLHLFYPSVEEQKAIVDYLDTVLEKSLKLEEYIYSQIKTLKNYRKSLIHECVSGKKQIGDMVE